MAMKIKVRCSSDYFDILSALIGPISEHVLRIVHSIIQQLQTLIFDCPDQISRNVQPYFNRKNASLTPP